MPRLFLALVTVPLAAGALLCQERKAILIPASQLAAPAQRDDTPTSGKWWLRGEARDWGAPGGMLLTGMPSDKTNKQGEWVVPAAHRFVPYRVPELVIDPKAVGWYRIFVSLFHESIDPVIRPQLWGRLSREPYPEYLRAPTAAAGRGTTEVLWKAADLTGQKIILSQPPAPMPHPGHGWLGGIAQVRLVPMSDADVKAARQEIELPPRESRLFGMFDYTDEVFWWGTLESEEDVKAIVYRHQESGFGRIYWRAYGSHLDNAVSVPQAAPRWSDADELRWTKSQNCKLGWKPYIDLTKKYDPLKVAVEYGDKIGCEVHAWVRMTNHNREPYAQFWHDHPEFAVQMVAMKMDPATGKTEPVKPYKRSPYRRVLSLAYPEVRAYYVSFFKQLASTGTKGIMIDLLRHPPIAGYEPVVADAFKKKYGIDMETRELYHDPLVQEHLAQYLRLFLIDLRKEIGNKIEISVRCSGPGKYALRGKDWIAEGLIDAVVDGNWYSGNGPRPTISETIEAAQKRGKAMAIAEAYDVDPSKNWARRPGDLSPEAILALSRHYSGGGVASFGLYESTIFTYYPELRRAIRQAGWEYEPTKK